MEGQAQVRLVFAGEVLAGHTLDEVKRVFGELFKLEGARLAAVFSGQRTVLKHSIGRDDGERYVARLRKIGMQVRVEPIGGLPEPKPLLAAAGSGLAAGRAAPSLLPLEEEVTCPNCGERQPKKFVLCRQCTTDIPRALANQAEEAERARAERLAARRQPGGRFAPPNAEVEAYAGGLVDPPPFLSLSFEGRYGRASYINTWFVAVIAAAAVAVLAAVLVPMLGRLMFVPAGLALLVFIVWSIRVSVLRLHDFNRSGWWILLSFIPYAGVLVNLVLLAWPGHAEENDYGPKPRRGNMVLAIALIVLTVGSVAMLASVALPAYQGYVKRSQHASQEAAERQADESRQQAAPRLPNGAAQQAFREQYLPASNEKAFAVSSAGAYGWSAGKASVRDAVSAALSECDVRRDAYTGKCRVVNVNGQSPKEN